MSTSLFRKWAVIATISALSSINAGCGPKSDPTAPSPETNAAQPAGQNGSEAKSEANKASMSLTAIPVANDLAKYTQSFDDAVISEVLEGQQQPPDETIGGKSTAKLRDEIEKVWSSIPLTHKGMTIPYVIEIETEDGVIEIALQTHLAPNHVRNMVALTRLGYYDGLRFDRLKHEVSDDKMQRLDLVSAGCPLGTGEEGFGHLGYTLKAETSPSVKHDEGTVGTWCDGGDRNAGACRFYITLGPAPMLDDNYSIVGKVIRGLDVVKKIAAKPVRGTSDAESEQPLQPIVMKKVTVRPDPLEKSPPVAQNTP